ncbi:glycosyltransferase [Geomicrobium sp. JCM 19039]|uniref:tetratricopeptide repeat-containing glycosyltransferase family 2 protein n=1 Tax=Geomicrobium sp. JCM 19039 TaxID=1460636 RepID=UPI00045F1CF3|nr:glycosyltransferase [Geomicrobium sp. JCM 19039]GAK10657.1 glycosyltransferase, group 2 family protein [Geomicrobium sp. JCM 19039]
MIRVSLCMIVKDEEEVLGGCLASVKDCVDEIVVVDTGSSDRTKEIAAQYTENVFDFEWVNHFAKARNFAFSKATEPFIMWLDADDIISEEDQLKLKKLKEDLDETTDAVSMKYHLTFDANGEPMFTYRRHRIVKAACGFEWQGAVHEFLQVGGNIVTSDVAITHRKEEKTVQTNADRNINIYEQMINDDEPFTPRDLFYYANELKERGRHEEAINKYEEFMQTNKWVEDEIRACQAMTHCYLAVDEPDQAVDQALRTLKLKEPRPESCCMIGNHFQQKLDFENALFWYQMAVHQREGDSLNFVNHAYSTWYPYLQQCVCYFRLGDIPSSKEANERAAETMPEHESVIQNRKLFADLEKQNKAEAESQDK